MKFLVCITKTPETTSKIGFTNGGSEFDTNGITYIMNPYDEWYALVRALELKEANGGTVTVMNVGDASNDTVIRKALAIGADDAIRINADPKSSLYIAKQIAEQAKNGGYDAIFCGKESVDYNGSEVGAMVAEFLGMPFISYANSIEISGQTATIARDIEGGVEVAEVEAPFVLSAAKGMAEQRIPNMKGIMMAKRKPLTVVEPVDFPDYSVPVHFELPPPKTGVTLIDPENMEELVRLLHEEAKVI